MAPSREPKTDISPTDVSGRGCCPPPSVMVSGRLEDARGVALRPMAPRDFGWPRGADPMGAVDELRAAAPRRSGRRGLPIAAADERRLASGSPTCSKMFQTGPPREKNPIHQTRSHKRPVWRAASSDPQGGVTEPPRQMHNLSQDGHGTGLEASDAASCPQPLQPRELKKTACPRQCRDECGTRAPPPSARSRRGRRLRSLADVALGVLRKFGERLPR